MADMMSDMGDMDGMSHGDMSGMDHGAMSGMGHGGMPGMDRGDMQMMDDTGVTMMDSGDMQMMDHSQHVESDGTANSLKASSKTARYAHTEYDPSTDMHADMVRTSLDNPGVGLCNDGYRVLVFADTHIIGGPMDKRSSEREVELHLTDNMECYTWSFDGAEFGKLTPVRFRCDGRLCVILHNGAMITHPMCLYNMWSGPEAPDGTFLACRHTISVQPAQRISFLVTANALGCWAWHYHLMLHMDADTLREVVVVWYSTFTAGWPCIGT